VACVSDATTTCLFPDYPGTVGWKNGYQALRDEPLGGVSEDACEAAEQSGAGCLRRFDHNRRDMFHYALFAHAIGIARADVDNPSTPYDERTTPTKNSGIADSPFGGDILVTLGFWDDFVGTPFMQGATLAHEFGHTIGLRHGGTAEQPNCKPNYLSVMNYLFQVQGLIPQAPNGAALPPTVDFSRQALPALDENALVESSGLGQTLYRSAWFAPSASSFIANALGSSPATRHCDGSPITDGAQMVRVDGTSVAPPIDWDADGVVDANAIAQDVNFNGGLGTLDAGTNDFASMDFRQVGSRRNVGGLSLDMGRGDLGRGDLGRGDLGRGDLGRGDLGRGDLGRGDLGRGDLGIAEADAPRGDLDFDVAANYANAPTTLRAAVVSKAIRLDWAPPHVNTVNVYFVYRVVGSTVTPANFAARVLVGQPAAPATTFTDTTTKNNVTYTYFVQAQFVDGSRSGISNFVTIGR